jgi:hypothetical protein
MTIIIQPYDVGCEPSPSVSAGILLQCGRYVYLLFFGVSKEVNKKTDFLDNLGVAILRCNGCIVTKCGYPDYGGGDINTLPEHSLFKYGLEDPDSSILEVTNSPWSLEVFEQMKKSSGKERHFTKPKIDQLKHFIIIFDEDTFECIASSLTVEKYCKTFDEAQSYVFSCFTEV